MLKKITALLLILVLLCGFAPSVFAEDEVRHDSDYYKEKIAILVDIIQQLGLYYEEGDDLVGDAIESFLAEYPLGSGKLEEKDLPQYFAAVPERFEAFANAMFQNHDQHSHYMEAVQYEESYTLEESFVGIGIEMDTTYSTGFYIVNVIPNTPAESVGLLAGDEIIAVDGVDVAGEHYSAAAGYLRGEEGTSVDVTVRRGDKTFDVTIVRASINLSNISFTDLGDGVAYIRISRFGTLQTFIDFLEIYNDLPYDGFRSVIFDVRNNLGGSFDTVLNMLNYIFWDADVPVLSIYTRDDGSETYTSMGAGWKPNMICVLVNEYTASAAEIFAGSLQVNDCAVIIGTTTFGKGVAQQHLTLDEGSTAIITNFEIMLGDGVSYNGFGISPDVESDYVEMTIDVSSYEPLTAKRVLMPGSTGKDVLALEQRLSVIGLFDAQPDEVFDKTTLTAVKQFQEYFELPIVNYAGHMLFNALNTYVNQLDGQTLYYDAAYVAAYELALDAAAEPLDYVLLPRTFEEYDLFYGEE